MKNDDKVKWFQIVRDAQGNIVQVIDRMPKPVKPNESKPVIKH